MRPWLPATTARSSSSRIGTPFSKTINLAYTFRTFSEGIYRGNAATARQYDVNGGQAPSSSNRELIPRIGSSSSQLGRARHGIKISDDIYRGDVAKTQQYYLNQDTSCSVHHSYSKATTNNKKKVTIRGQIPANSLFFSPKLEHRGPG